MSCSCMIKFLKVDGLTVIKLVKMQSSNYVEVIHKESFKGGIFMPSFLNQQTVLKLEKVDN